MSELSYLDLLDRVLMMGHDSPGRDGAPTICRFGEKLEFDMADGFPLLTTKKLHFRSIAYELLWMIAGRTNVRWLNERGVTIWDEWAGADGELGPIYGKQWRSWAARNPDGTVREIDQLTNVIDLLRRDPNSRRALVSAWNVADLDEMALPPCHVMFQFRIIDGRLHLQVYQRSADLFLGLPFNIASYSLLLCMVAEILEVAPGRLHHVIGDAHIYLDHRKQVGLQLEREPTKLPTLMLKVRDRLPAFRYEDISLLGYSAQPHIPAPVSK